MVKKSLVLSFLSFQLPLPQIHNTTSIWHYRTLLTGKLYMVILHSFRGEKKKKILTKITLQVFKNIGNQSFWRGYSTELMTNQAHLCNTLSLVCLSKLVLCNNHQVLYIIIWIVNLWTVQNKFHTVFLKMHLHYFLKYISTITVQNYYRYYTYVTYNSTVILIS